MNKTELLKLVSDAYDYACKKHPFFAYRAMGLLPVKCAEEKLVSKREFLKYRIKHSGVDGTNVLECEIAEASEAYATKSYDNCIEELAQCAAVILRMIEKVEEESKE